MPMGLRRFLLILSVIIMAFGGLVFYLIYEFNNNLTLVEAEIIKVDKHFGILTYKYESNGEFLETESYETNSTINVSNVGDKVDIYIDYGGRVMHKRSYRLPEKIALIGFLLFIIGAKAIKGFYKDFILRYKKTHIFGLIYIAFFILFTLWCSTEDSQFGGALVLWLLGAGLSIILWIIIWIVTVARYHHKHKKQ